ncbi:MAG: MFS transporter [Henriciella sp.]
MSNASASLDLPTPAEIIENEPMSAGQWLVIALCSLLMALDGYDVMSIALAGAGIAEEWSLSKQQLGFLLPLEFIGMAVGSIFIGSFSDNFGRRITILLCLLILTVGMGTSGYAPNFEILAASRVFTGLGIGGILAGATALSSEYSNAKYRSLAVLITAAGYTTGVYLVSKVAGPILIDYDWRVIFKLGALISLFFLPVFAILAPESIGFLDRKGKPDSDQRISRTLVRIGRSDSFRRRQLNDQVVQTSIKNLFDSRTARITTVMMICYLGNILTYYFFVKWMPPAVIDLGYSKAQGTEVLAAISLGGLFGTLTIALFSRFYPLKPLMIIALFGSAVFVALFPFFTQSLDSMSIVGGLAGFCLFAAIGGFFALFAQSFPPAVLASGAGMVLGFGRGGAVSGPWLGGILFGAGIGLMVVSPIMAMGSALASGSLLLLKKDKVEITSS